MKIIKLLLFCLTLSILPGCGEEEFFIPEGYEFGGNEEEGGEEGEEEGGEEGGEENVEIIVEGTGAVDLGLSVKWAACDLGALRPYVSGDLIEGGDFGSGLYENQNVSGTEKDPATKILGKPWRLPTKQEFEELIADCKWIHAKYHNVDGWYVTGPTGKTIFLKDGTRWSGTFLYKSSGYWDHRIMVLTAKSYIKIEEESLEYENSIRPVCD